METTKLRQLWSIIETIQPTVLLNLDKPALSEFLVKKLDERMPLSAEENHIVNNYIYSKTSLILDLAEARL